MIIESERAVLRKYTLDDTDFIINLLNQQSFIENIGDRGIKTIPDAEDYLKKSILNSYQQNGFGLNMVELKESKIPIGMCGILKRDTLDHADLGYAFLPEYCGLGYASEITETLIQSAKRLYNLEKIVAITNSHNKKSRKLLEKIGFKFDCMVQAVEGEAESMLFAIDL